MNEKQLQRHFAECDLPIKMIGENPRGNDGHPDDIENLHYIDVIGSVQQGEQFRVFAGTPTVEVEVLNKRPQTRHILVMFINRLAQLQPWRRQRRYLMGHDERQLFVVDGGTAKTVDEAIENLKPWDVRRAEQHGLKITRQGDWFFIAMPDGRLSVELNALTYHNEQIGGPNAVRGRNPHIAENQVVSALGVFVRGKIRHAEHATITLRGWHRAVPNVVNPSRALGYWD